MPRPTLVFGAALGMAAASGPAYAGSAVPKLGNPQVSATRHLSLGMSVLVRHDSNVARSSATAAADHGLKPSDERVIPGIDAEVMLPFGKHYFSLSGDAGYELFRRNTRLNHETMALDSTLGLDFNVCRPELTAAYSRKQSDLGEIGATPIPGVDSVKNVESTLSTGAAVSCGAVVGIRPAVSIHYEHATNDNVLRAPVNYNSVIYAAGLGYEHPAVGNILLFVSQDDIRFPRQPLAGIGDNGYSMRHYGAKFVRQIGARMQGSFELTYAEIDPRAPLDLKANGINWNADLTATASSRLKLHGAISRQIVTTLSTAALFHRDTSYALDATYALNERASAKIGFIITPRRFYGAAETEPFVDFGPVLTHDRQSVYSGSLSYNLSPRLNLLLEAARETRNANGSYFDYSNNRVGLSLAFKFDAASQTAKR